MVLASIGFMMSQQVALSLSMQSKGGALVEHCLIARERYR